MVANPLGVSRLGIDGEGPPFPPFSPSLGPTPRQGAADSGYLRSTLFLPSQSPPSSSSPSDGFETESSESLYAYWKEVRERSARSSDGSSGRISNLYGDNSDSDSDSFALPSLGHRGGHGGPSSPSSSATSSAVPDLRWARDDVTSDNSSGLHGFDLDRDGDEDQDGSDVASTSGSTSLSDGREWPPPLPPPRPGAWRLPRPGVSRDGEVGASSRGHRLGDDIEDGDGRGPVSRL